MISTAAVQLLVLEPIEAGRESERARVEAAVPHPGPLLVTVEESDATLRLRLAGEFDLAAVPLVEKALDRLSRAPVLRRLVLDLTAVSFLDLAGVRTILRADARGRAEAFEVVVVRPRGTANRIFTLTRVGDQLNMVNEPEPA